MSTVIITNVPPYSFGQMTNMSVSRLVALNTQLARLQEAVATASSGFQGVQGTQFELPSPGANDPATNLFGVQPSAVPGEQGLAYSYAIGQLHSEWAKFWQAARPYIDQLDNGTYAM